MAEISTTIDDDADLAIFVISGVVTADDIIDAHEIIFSQRVVKNCLWDISLAQIHSVDQDEISRIFSYLEKFDHLRKGGRAAFVANSAMALLMAKLYSEVSSAVRERPISYQIFTDMDEAVAWLKGK